MALVDSEGLEPSLSRVRAGCASVALRAHWGGRRDSNPHYESHRLVRFPYATTTMKSARKESNRHRPLIGRLHFPCATGGETEESRGFEPPDPERATRLANGHLAPVQDGLSR